MARQDDIEDLLKEVAPLLGSIASQAQEASAGLGDTDWARTYLTRTASVNQIAGTARWRMVGDEIVRRQHELPAGLELSTTDEEQNQGRYYLRAPSLAIILTVRRKPHREDDEPKALQMQIDEVLEQAPIDYGDKLVVYLAVPPFGQEPRFDVAARGKVAASHKLVDLIDESNTGKDARDAKPEQFPQSAAPGPKVKSTLDEERAEEDVSRSDK
jgi:hypothetical protein